MNEAMTEDHGDKKDVNRAYWDALFAVNAAADTPDGYNVSGFLAGETDLHPIELGELPDLDGLSLLHLQCHFGLDTLRLARKGASVTGLDFSEPAIEKARWLAGEAGIEASFVHGDFHDAPKLIDGAFDAVFCSWGTVSWLPDIKRWAEIIAHFLKPGGWFYIADVHPTMLMMEDEDPEGPVRVAYPYFHKPEPLRFESSVAYIDNETKLAVTETYEWNHPIGEIVTSLIDAGLRLDFLHEHPEITWMAFPFLVPGRRGQYRMPDDRPNFPLSFSLKATKPVS